MAINEVAEALESDIGDGFEARREPAADFVDALEPPTPRVGPARRLEDGVLREVAEDRVEIVCVEIRSAITPRAEPGPS